MFDPYAKWLGITKRAGTPNHFELLGLSPDVDDADVIASVADMRMAHVRTFQSGQYSKESQQILNELSQARICLLDPQRRAAYRATLSQETALKAPAAPPPNAERPLAAAPPVRGRHVAPEEAASASVAPESTGLPEPWSIDVDSSTSTKGNRGKRPGPPPSRHVGAGAHLSENPFAAPASQLAAPTAGDPRRVSAPTPRRTNQMLILILGAASIVVGAICVALLMFSRQSTVVAPDLAFQPSTTQSQPSPAPPPDAKPASTAVPKPATAPKPPEPKPPKPKPPVTPSDTRTKPVPTENEKKPAAPPLPPLVAYDRGEPVNLLASAGLPGDIIKVAGPPASEFEVTANGLKKLPAAGALESSLLPLPLGMQTAKEKWKRENYRFSTRVTPQSQGAIFFSFPVSQRQFVAFFGGAGRNVGFAVEPRHVSSEVRKDVGPVQAGRAYNFEVTVQTLADDQARITARLDGKPVILWQGSTQQVVPDDSVAAMPNQNEQVVFGFGTQQEIAAELHEFKVQKLPREANAEHQLRSKELLGQQ